MEASLIYRASSRTVRATQRNTVSEKKKQKKNTTKKESFIDIKLTAGETQRHPEAYWTERDPGRVFVWEGGILGSLFSLESWLRRNQEKILIKVFSHCLRGP